MCMCMLQAEDAVIAQRPQTPATMGTAVQVVTNFYKVNFANTPPLMHHDLRVDKMHFDRETRALPCLEAFGDAVNPDLIAAFSG